MMSRSTNTGQRPSRYILASLLGVFLSGLLLTTSLTSGATPERDSFGRSGGVFLEMDGGMVGWLKSADGGYAKAQVSEYMDGRSTVPIKRVSGIEVEDLTISFGVDMSPRWWEWVSDVLGEKPAAAHDIAIVRTDYDGQTIERIILRQAMLKRIEFPIFDAAKREPVFFKAVITARSSQHQLVSGQGPALARTQAVMSHAFRFELGDLPTTRTLTVVPPVVSIGITDGSTGDRMATTSSARTTVGDMTMIRGRSGEDMRYFDWLRDLLEGRESGGSTMPATLSILGADLRQVLMTIHFDQVGLISVDTAWNTASDSIPSMRIEMYVSGVRVESGG